MTLAPIFATATVSICKWKSSHNAAAKHKLDRVTIVRCIPDANSSNWVEYFVPRPS